MKTNIFQIDSSPVGNRKRHTTCGITCPSVTFPGEAGTPSSPGWVGVPVLVRGYPILSWLGGVTTSCLGWRHPIPSFPGGNPFLSWLGVNQGRVPYLGLGYHPIPSTGVPTERDLDPVTGVPLPQKGHGTSGWKYNGMEYSPVDSKTFPSISIIFLHIQWVAKTFDGITLLFMIYSLSILRH